MQTTRDDSQKSFRRRITLPNVVLLTEMFLIAACMIIICVQRDSIYELNLHTTRVLTLVQKYGPNDVAAASKDSIAAPPHKQIDVPRENSMIANKGINQLGQRVQSERYMEAIGFVFGPLIRHLNLDSEKTAQFNRLLNDERQAMADAIQAAKVAGAQSPQDFIAAIKEAEGEIDLQIETLLGADGFAQFQAYRQTLPEQQTVNRLAATLSTTQNPLSELQKTQLVQFLNQMETPEFRQSKDFLAMIGLSGAPLTNSMVAASSSILNPSQVQALDAMQKRLQAREQLIEMLERDYKPSR